MESEERAREGCPGEKTAMMLMGDLNKVIHNRLRKASEEGELQASYRPILFHLAHKDGISQYTVAQLTRLKPPTVSVTLRKMEADGYVKRVTDGNDLRQINVFLTEKGRRYNERMHEVIMQTEKDIMAGITAEENEVLVRLICRMTDNLEGK